MAKEASSVSGGGSCPFSWIQVAKPAGCLTSEKKVVSEPQPCMREACKLWDSSENNCGLITKR